MQNLKKLEKSKGILIFAFNTEKTDYVKIADRASTLAQRALGLPITLVTDPNAEPSFAYDQVIRIENRGNNYRNYMDQGQIPWRNTGRYMAYELSPYNDTMLIDADYLMFDNSLDKLWAQDFDYRLMRQNRNIDGPAYSLMGDFTHNLVWATVVLFRKTTKSKMLFDLVGRIQRNYGYYKKLYLLSGPFRNDYAFAIADRILNGYTTEQHASIPWKMQTVDFEIDSIESADGRFIVRSPARAIVVPKTNLHIMSKEYLLSDNCLKLIESTK